MFNNPFRQEVTAKSANRQHLDRLLRITAPHERIALVSTGSILAVVLAWVLFGGIVREMTFDGVLLAAGHRHDVMSTEAGYLTEFLVEPGDVIEPGTVIARQSVPELEREIAALRDRVARLAEDVERTGGGTGGVGALLAAARVALIENEARHAARQLIVSHAGGEVTALRSSAGAHVAAGATIAELRDAGDDRLQAVLVVAPRAARRLRPGMRASAEVRLPDGATRQLDGNVRAVATAPPPELGAEGWGYARHVYIDLRAGPDPDLPDGTPCRVRIVLGRVSPASLLGLGST